MDITYSNSLVFPLGFKTFCKEYRDYFPLHYHHIIEDWYKKHYWEKGWETF